MPTSVSAEGFMNYRDLSMDADGTRAAANEKPEISVRISVVFATFTYARIPLV